MIAEALQKITATHLSRQAMLYVRQSTLHQVFENTESTARQYGLRERAVALGWPREQIVVIDQDLGQSGASAVDRADFQRLVAEVGLGQVGLVLGLEVSRLARSSADWHHLLEICALTGTLILDEDGLYDPAAFNDRLLLGLKGAMSEAELPVLRARLQGGILNKAQRGALKLPLPIGLVYAEDETVCLDPDAQVQQALRLLFATFQRTGSARATVRYFRDQGVLFPNRPHTGLHAGELHFAPLLHATTLHVLHNPRYTGAFCFGRTRSTKQVDGTRQLVNRPQDQWLVLLRDQHPGYLTWEEYQANLQQLERNRQAYGHDRRHGPPREGPALLQGLVLCGRCGKRMSVRYHQRASGLCPSYVCQRERIDRADAAPCQCILGAGLDAAMGELLLAQVTPLTIEMTLEVYAELQAQTEEAQHLRTQQVERARYAAELAQRRYVKVDPNNRLVADVLEAEWNARLRELAQVQEEAERQQKEPPLTAQDEQAIRALVEDFPSVWRDPRTSDRQRKRLVRWLVEDVTLDQTEVIAARIRFRGGATQTLTLPISTGKRTDTQLMALLDRLLDNYTDGGVAEQLNQAGWRTYEGRLFSAKRVLSLRRDHGLRDQGTRVRERGWLSTAEAAKAYGVNDKTLLGWGRAGLVPMTRTDDRGTAAFRPPDAHAPTSWALKFSKPH
jgi:DNA invertase Pin-like site-specific DNA recombinase